MARVLSYVVLIAVSVVALFYTVNAVAVGVWTGVATALLIPLIDLLLNNRRYLRIAASVILRPRAEIRISFSYLIRFRDSSKYLLVRGGRYPNNYQPIGGVYKFNPSVRAKFAQWRVLDDQLIPIDKVSSDDLRLRVPARNLLRFLHWFESGYNREVGVWREFREEMIETGFVRETDFRDLRFDFLRSHVEPIHYSHHAARYELMVAHIYDAVLTENQLKILRALDGSGGGPCWFGEEQIRRRGATLGMAQPVEIPPTAAWTL